MSATIEKSIMIPPEDEVLRDSANQNRITVLGVRTFYISAGNSGTPLLLIHGGGSDFSGFSWKYAIGALAKSHHVIALDLPGYGQSDSPDLSKIKNPFLYHIDFIKAFLDALNLKKTNVIGISMGGGISLGFALKYPKHLDNLVIVDSYGLGKKVIGGVFTYIASRMPFLNELLRLILQNSRALTKLGVLNLIYNRNRFTDEIISDAWQSLRSAGMHKTWKAFQKHEVTFSGYRSDFTDKLHKINAPTLIIHGAQDRLIPVKWAERAHQLIANSELHIFENCGHLPPRELPEAFNTRIMKFLD